MTRLSSPLTSAQLPPFDVNQTPWGPIGYITYKRTYARRLDPSEPGSATEELPQTIERVLEACRTQLDCGFTKDEEQRLRYYLSQLKGSVAGRFLWQLGTETVEKHGLLSLQNCAYTNVDEPIRPFTWAFDALMLGSGVGFGIQKRHVSKLPTIKQKIVLLEKVLSISEDGQKELDHAWRTGSKHLESARKAKSFVQLLLPRKLDDRLYMIGDSREGWVNFLECVLGAAFYDGEQNPSHEYLFHYCTAAVRPRDYPIRGFGGTASGPDELVRGIGLIVEILNKRVGQQLTSIDCLDIMNIIGMIVVAGNVRRSAEIAIGDADDIEYLQAKAWWKEGGIPNWRNMSNNSVECADTSLLPYVFWETYERGEPYGLINLALARLVGRTGEIKYPDPTVEGFNPCAEQGLANKETCALAETFLSMFDSYDQFCDWLRLVYRIVKHSLRLTCHLKDTEEIVHENMRMGIGVTGLYECSEEQLSWLDPAYEELRIYDEQYSGAKNWPISVKLTTVKPGGTLPLMPGVVPGAHGSPAGPKYIRRMRISASSPLVDVCRSHGFPVEPQRNFDGTEDPTTMVVSFPCEVAEGVPVGNSMGALAHMDFVRRLQREWSDNSVSCTIYYTKEELPAIKEYLAEHFTSEMKTVSFLLYYGHGFDQAPYETISEEYYQKLVAASRPITSITLDSDEAILDADCEGGACPIR